MAKKDKATTNTAVPTVAPVVTAPPVPVAPVAMTPAEIMGKIAAAGASGDLAEVIRLGNLLKKHQTEILKAEADKLQKEAEAMAGDRTKLAEVITDYIRAGGFNDQMVALKVTGFSFKLPYLDQNNVMTKVGVALMVPAIKQHKVGGGGGSTGALKSQTGLSRHELVEQYATAEEKANIAKAETEAVTRPDSARYTAEKPVIKRILADNPHLIKH